MKTKTKVSLFIIAIIALFITLVITLSSLFQVAIENSGSSAKIKALSADDADLADHYTDATHNNTYIEAVKEQFNGLWIPEGVYCIQHGTAFYYVGHYGTWETSDLKAAYDGKAGSAYSGHGCASSYPLQYGKSVWQCGGNHYKPGDKECYYLTTPKIYAPKSGSYNWSYAGESTSFSAGEDITEEIKQAVIWKDRDGLATSSSFMWGDHGEYFTYEDIADKLLSEAKDYEQYREDLKNYGDDLLTNGTEKRPTFDINTEKNYTLIGPYTVNYLDGKYNGAIFAGITKITVKGYNDKKLTKYIKDCEILKCLQDGEDFKLDYYDPTETNGYVDKKERHYPKSGVEFWLKVKNPNVGDLSADDVVRYFDIDVEYAYMEATATVCKMVGYRWSAVPTNMRHTDTPHQDPVYESYTYTGSDGKTHTGSRLVGYRSCHSCSKNWTWKVMPYSYYGQQSMIDAWGERKLYKLHIQLRADSNDKDEEPEPFEMKLGGYVWEDVAQGKEGTTGLGKFDGGDIPVPNVKVTLYEYTRNESGSLSNTAKVAELLSTSDKQELKDEEILKRINPQLTDQNGYYEFNGLNPFSKYYVTFEYNGQVYLPTDYKMNINEYNTVNWQITSKATETNGDRKAYNNKFAEIGSSPKNYKSSDSLHTGALTGGYNQAFSMYDLLGFKLQSSGGYSQGTRLIDGREYIGADGNIYEGTTIQEGEISKKIQEYIKSNKKYPNDNELRQIYMTIAGGDQTTLRKLQYIEDCKIKAYTTSPGHESISSRNDLDLYPVYDKFTITENNVHHVVGDEDNVYYKPIYTGQFYVNLGLWRRQQNDLALRKDVYRATVKINGKTEVYKYNERATGDNELLDNDNLQWNIQLRMSDYDNYYGPFYSREILKSDYDYKPEKTNVLGSKLEVYITYQIVIRNTSMSVVDKITEVVDYYDKDYTLVPDLSWVMYKPENSTEPYEGVSVPKGGENKQSGFYNMMHELDINKLGVGGYARDPRENASSMYGSETHSDITRTYNSVYIRGLDGRALSSGENAYIYLTFKVNSDEKGPVILDDLNSLKYNFAEINGYKSFYADGTNLPNGVHISGNSTVAGLVDVDSVPGNLESKDIQGDHYEKNFEDDTDRARGLAITLDEESTRKLNGTAFEDERTKTIGNSIIGDGLKQDKEIGIKGVDVELVEKLENGSEYVWQTTTTGENGSYEFSGYIPGNYYIRFKYGNNNSTVLTAKNGGQNAVSYNGQDFKSTVYGKDLNSGTELMTTDDTLYDIAKHDNAIQSGINLSDAKDIWSNLTVNVRRGTSNFKNETYQGRETVNKYSDEIIKNGKAEILASPYADSINQSNVQELMTNTNMTAQTPIIVAEVEYNRTNSVGDKTISNNSNDSNYLFGNDKNGTYVINSVDLGLTERPKAQLEINKKISNIKVTLANGTVLFDAAKSTDNLAWVASKAYNMDKDMKNGKYKDYYDESKRDNSKNRYSYRDDINTKINEMFGRKR